jgi:homoserine kinase type II
MAVFTTVTEEQAQSLIDHLQLGQLQNLQGIKGGIENTNYFVNCDAGQFVLTLFERLSHEQLPFYLYLMKHLANNGIPVPNPVMDKQGELLFTLCNKPAAIVNRLTGQSELNPQVSHCRAVGEMLAKMHLAGKDFGRSQSNLRGLSWWNETCQLVLPHLNQQQKSLLIEEVAFANHIQLQPSYQALPKGPIHADLFRDNVMFEQGKLSGFFDFYFAGIDHWLFDLAVCLNDWCIDQQSGCWNVACRDEFIEAYQSVRILQPNERRLLSAFLRHAALRFWISRLWDFHLPRDANLLKPHDPTHFERVLLERVNQPWCL